MVTCKISILVLVTFIYWANGFKRVCYYGAWSARNELQPENIDASLCTHLILAFAKLDDNFTNLIPENKFESNLLSPFTHLKKSNPDVKVLLALGGWVMGSTPYMVLVSNEATMHTFATHAVTFLRAHNFDGLDLDWEFPNDRGSEVEDKTNFITLLKIVHNAFVNEPNLGGKDRLMLTAPVGVTEKRIIQSYDVQGLIQYLDLIGLMTYDFHGEWEGTVNVHNALYSATDNSVDRSVQYWLSLGVPKDKLLVGVPLYGRKFMLSDPTNNTIGAASNGGGDIAYYEICEMLQNHRVSHVRLSVEKVPYFTYSNQWITYEDVQSITEKADYIHSHGLAGAMVWAIHLDDFAGVCGHGKYPLTRALKKAAHEQIAIG